MSIVGTQLRTGVAADQAPGCVGSVAGLDRAGDLGRDMAVRSNFLTAACI